MALKKVFRCGLKVWVKRHISLWISLGMLALGGQLAFASSTEANEPVVEEILLQAPTERGIYKEVTSPHPDDKLLDPAGWDSHPETKSIRVRPRTSSKGSYEVPHGCSTTGIDKNDLNTLDMLHHRFSRGLCAPTEWLDNAFGDPLEEVEQKASSTIRVVGTQKLQDDGSHEDGVAFKARIKMPRFEKRWSLMLESERDFDDAEVGFASGSDSQDNRSSSVSAALQWARQRSSGLEVKSRVGFYRGLKGHVKFSARRQRQINERWLWRLTESIDWRDQLGWRSFTTLDFDRPMGPVRLFRATSAYEHSKELHVEGRGERWQQTLAVASQLNKRVAMRYSTSVEGYTKPDNRVDSYRAAVTYRRNTWRPWFYVEVEPYLYWPRYARYETLVGIVLRVETLFGEY